MSVVGLTINNITAKRTNDQLGPVEIGHKVGIKNVEETDLSALGKKGLKVSFEFETSYTDDKKKAIGEILITGEVFYLANNLAELVMGWKREKKLPDDVNIVCINTVIKRCMNKAIVLAEDVNLPPPIPIPFAQKDVTQDNKSRYIG